MIMNLRPRGYSGVFAVTIHPTIPHELVPGSRATSVRLSESSRISSWYSMHSVIIVYYSANVVCLSPDFIYLFMKTTRHRSGKSTKYYDMINDYTVLSLYR